MIPYPPYYTQPDPEPDRPLTRLDYVIFGLVCVAWVLAIALLIII